MNPFEIRDEIKRIRGLESVVRNGDALARVRIKRIKERLRLQVLQQIAKGSVDAKSLAIAVLELD